MASAQHCLLHLSTSTIGKLKTFIGEYNLHQFFEKPMEEVYLPSADLTQWNKRIFRQPG
jgi:hypothetical protein